MAKKHNFEDVVRHLRAEFPDDDPGPSGIWGFVKAGWDGPVDRLVDDEELDGWVESWEAAKENGWRED